MSSPVLILPGLGNSGPEHWQSHWEHRDPGCVRVAQQEWDAPNRAEWVATLAEAIARVTEPVVLVGHSTGCTLVAHWVAAAQTQPDPARRLAAVRGALLVAPSDPTGLHYPPGPEGFAPVPLGRLPFPSIVVASTNDPYVTIERARDYASAWGASLIVLEDAGHINVASGHGAWAEGFDLLAQLRS